MQVLNCNTIFSGGIFDYIITTSNWILQSFACHLCLIISLIIKGNKPNRLIKVLYSGLEKILSMFRWIGREKFL